MEKPGETWLNAAATSLLTNSNVYSMVKLSSKTHRKSRNPKTAKANKGGHAFGLEGMASLFRWLDQFVQGEENIVIKKSFRTYITPQLPKPYTLPSPCNPFQLPHPQAFRPNPPLQPFVHLLANHHFPGFCLAF